MSKKIKIACHAEVSVNICTGHQVQKRKKNSGQMNTVSNTKKKIFH